MSNAVALPDRPSHGEASTFPEGVRRTAFYFDSQGQGLFGWLHRPARAVHCDHGVVICAPFGHEQIHSHRSLRHLADAVAEAGFPVVRFDYHGTGDSSGSGDEPDRVATWLANIRDACLWLQQHLGCTPISLIGLRLGATLAAQVAADLELDGLVLWAPVNKGRSYVREVKALSLTTAESPKPAGDIEAAGLVLTEKTGQELSRLDLLKSAARCRRALMIARDDMPEDLQLLKHFEQLGIEATQAAQPGYADMMADPHYTKVPHEAITYCVDWLLAGTGDEPANTDKPVPANAIDECNYKHAICLEHGIRERVFPISLEPNLFGVLTEPADGAGADLPMIVMINGGSCHRVGPNRLYVGLARMLAGRGFRSLRMDLCGLGDSVGSDPESENHCYPETGFRDIDLALKSLRTQLGVDRVVLLGLCSGAYTAFQAAVQQISPALVESILINPLTFFWRDGMPLEFSPAHQLKSFQNVMASLWQPRKWWKLLSGRSKIGIAGVLRILLQRWKPSRAGKESLSILGKPAVDALPTHPLRDDLPGDLDRVAKNRRRLACFFARSDPGHAILAHQAKRKVDELSRAGMLNVYFLEDADHTFSRRAQRHALGEAISEHLARQYLYSPLK